MSRRRIPRRLWVTAVLAIAVFLCSSPLVAQETVNNASISGRVTDPSGAVVTGAAVSVRQLDTNAITPSTTDGEGRFRFTYLKVGRYEITVRAPQFAEFTKQLTLTVGSAFELPIGLAIEAAGDSVTVSGSALVLEAARTQIAGTVSQEELAALPLNGRQFLDIALLVPGVSPPNLGSTQLFAETSAIPGSGLSVASQRNLSNNFIVDGLSSNDDAAALTGMPYGVDAVDQFQVVTSGGQAELGRALGGYVNIVTRSGTNRATGDFYSYFRDDSVNAENPLLRDACKLASTAIPDPDRCPKTLPMDQQQWGVSVGGPIVHDRTFYFANVEQRNLDQTGLVTITAPDTAAINARLRQVGYPGPAVVTGIYPNPVDTTNGLLKVDHQFSDRDQFTVRYSLYRARAENSRGAGGLSAPSASAGLDNIDQGLALSNIRILTPRTVNETRAQITHSDLKAPSTDLIGPAVSIASVANFGTLSSSPQSRVNTLVQVVNNLSHQAGAHAVRMGVDVLYNDDAITFPRAFRGAYTFSTLTTFLSGAYNNSGFTQTFGATDVSQTNPNLGIYAQDEWKAGNALTVNAGLRYDLQFLETINTDRNNVSPRIGFAWLPSKSRRTVVRGSGGLFFDRIPLRAVANALLSAGNTTDLTRLRQTNVTLSPAQAGAPVFPDILAAPVPFVTLLNLTTMDRQMQNAYSRQASLEFERMVSAKSTVSVGYDYLAGRNLIIQINQNVPTCAASGSNNGCRPNPNYANNNQYSSAAKSDYHGFHVSFSQRPTHWGSFRVSYTLSKAMNNVGESFFSSPIDPTDLQKDWGRSDDDQRHRLVVSGTINTPMTPGDTPWSTVTHGFTISSMLQAYSALPFNITSGVTTIQGTSGRPIVDGQFIERNAGEGTPTFTMSLRVARRFALGRRLSAEGLFEIFNLTNHVNPVTRNGVFGTGPYPTDPLPSFNRVTAVGESRSLQLGVRLRF